MKRAVKNTASLKPYEWWNDEKLTAELDKRSAALKSGSDKGVIWSDVRDKLLNKL